MGKAAPRPSDKILFISLIKALNFVIDSTYFCPDFEENPTFAFCVDLSKAGILGLDVAVFALPGLEGFLTTVFARLFPDTC
jgi:hypothetical protein